MFFNKTFEIECCGDTHRVSAWFWDDLNPEQIAEYRQKLENAFWLPDYIGGAFFAFGAEFSISPEPISN